LSIGGVYEITADATANTAQSFEYRDCYIVGVRVFAS